MKNFKLILLTCFCLFLSTVSCDKEPVLSQNQDTPNVIQARANAAAKARKDIDKAFLNYDFSKYKIIPMWDLAVVAKNKKSVEVPYTINGKLLMPSVSKTLKGRQRLLLTLNGSKVSVLIMQYIPDAKFAGNTKEIYAENFKSKKFTGKITLQKIDSEEKTVWVLDLGKVSKKLISRKTAKKNLRPTEWVCTYWEQETYWYQWNSGTEEWYYTNTTIEYGEDCEYVDDTPPYDPYDCNNNSSWPWCDNGNGGGGGPSDDSECYASLDAIANNTSPSNEMIREEIISNSDGISERMYIWKVRNGPVWHVESNEKGVVNTNTHEFISFTHDFAQIVGPHVLVFLTNDRITVTPPSSVPSSYKTVVCYFTINYGIQCDGNVLSNPYPYDSTRDFYAY